MRSIEVLADTLSSGMSSAVAPIARRLAPHVHPDVLTAARAAFAVPIALALTRGWPAGTTLAMYGAAWLTDLLDGPTARERRRLGYPINGDRGELLDTVADKILLLATLITLAWCALRSPTGGARGTVELAIVVGEGYLLGRRVARHRCSTHAVPSMPLGKLKVALQAIATALLIGGQLSPQSLLTVVGTGLLVATVPLTGWSVVVWWPVRRG